MGALFADAGASSSGSSALGDLICVEGDCKIGEANVIELYRFWQGVGSPADFSAAVGAITAAYNDANDKLSRQIPFSVVCCEIKALGEQAKKLIPQIAAAAGVKPPPGLEEPRSGLELLAGALTVGAALLLAKSAVETFGGRKK